MIRPVILTVRNGNMNKQLFIEISFIARMKYRLVYEDLEFGSGEEYEYLGGSIESYKELNSELVTEEGFEVSDLYKDNYKLLEDFMQEYIDELGYALNNVHTEVYKNTIEVLGFKKEGETYVYYEV